MEVSNRFTKFVASRLIEAREIRGMTTTELAKLIGVSQQSVSKYENEGAVPTFDTLESISTALELPATFFYKPQVEGNDSVVFFRSKSAATVKSKKVHSHKIKWIKEIADYLEQFLELPQVNIPRFITRERYIPTDYTEIDEMALKVRELWGLGNGPISNVVLLLEKMGVIVGRSSFSDYSIDACSFWIDDERPIMLLSNDKTAARSRFDVAHELAHLVLHSKISQTEFNNKENYKAIENEAHRFAGAFLLPSPSFGTEVLSTSLEHFISLKKRWKVSIGAMSYRSKDLDIFSDYQYINMRSKMAKNKWLTKEPLDDELPFEEPVLLKQAIEAVIDNRIKTKQDFVSDVGIHREEIEAIANLYSGYLLQNESAKVIPIRFKQ
ncbi:helix-turn-helix domain-containing protein [Paenibacillus agilis]|uniref:ImmA/IrrE family metallo-endopeptidase n=1 Tax=Paenibacillus agilis TaxID=3020863 RepID=A0A559IZL0_9BACL|nr:XRE family transcriptional regulator [Paenibacillus agilis]TVX93068.1 ImmA/IrrE family metallo-endopeptidase [Paenibacillus agilis]